MVPAAQAVRGVAGDVGRRCATERVAPRSRAGRRAARLRDLVVGPSGPTWDLGELTGELESLAVAEDARGCGVGGALIAAARATLRERGVLHWYVGVVGANAGAIALYEREGFRPFFVTMLSTVEDATG